jgi:hypothetical protein
VIGTTASRDRVFVEHAKHGRRLSRVENGDAPRCRIDEPPRHRRHAAHPLQKVQGRSFGGEQRPRQPSNLGECRAARHRLAVDMNGTGLDTGFALAKCLEGDLEPGDGAGALRQEDPTGPLVSRHRRFRRDVTSTDILGKGPADDVAIFVRPERHRTRRPRTGAPALRC